MENGNNAYIAYNYANCVSLVISNLSGFVTKRGRNTEGAVLHSVLESVTAVVLQRNNTKSIRQLFFDRYST